MSKIIISLFLIMFSINGFSNCLELYKKRASFKEQRARKDKNPYNTKQARRAREDANMLGNIISGNSKDVDMKLWLACTNIFFAPGMPSRERNADLYCTRPMLKTYPGFSKYVAQKNNTKAYCPPQDLGWFKKKMRGERSYPPTEFKFSMGAEFKYYFFKVYKGK